MKKSCCSTRSPKPKQKQRKTKTPPSNKRKHKKVVIKSQKQKQYEKVTKSLNQKPTITFGNNNQEHREYLTTFINIILDAISDKSYVIASSESIILNNIIQSLSRNNKIRILLQTDKEWCEFLLKEKIIHYKLESIISSLRADLLQEQYIDTTNKSSSSSSNKENNILQQLQSFLQYMNDTEQDTTNSILNMMNICSLCLLKPKCKKTSSVLYFVIESYAKLVFHYINITTSNIKREDKLVTFSNVISSLDNAHKLKFCAYFLRLWKQQQQEKDIDDDCMIWDICNIIQMTLPSSSSCPRLIGNTIDQLSKFIDWSNDVLNLPTNHEDSDHSVDGVNEDNVNNNKLLDTSAYDHYLLSDDDDDSTESSSDSLDEEEDDNDDDDDESMKEHDSDSLDVEEEQEVKNKKNDK